MKFNPDWLTDISVVRRDDQVLLEVGEDTLGVNPTSDGYSLTPDWNNRRFTLAITEESVLYHLTEESVEKKRGNEGNIAPESFIAEIYGAVRTIAPLYPVSHLLEESDFAQVGKISFDAIEEYLKEAEVIELTESGVEVDAEKKNKLQRAYAESQSVRKRFLDEVLSLIPASEMVESGEQLFILPDKNYFPILLLLFPDEYVGVTRPPELFFAIENMTGSRSVDLLIQTLVSTGLQDTP
jgi:hypothetical protein